MLRLTQSTALVLVVSSGAMLISNARAYGEADDWVEHTHGVLDELDQVRVTLLRGGIALRDFALVPREISLQRTRLASEDARQAAQRLEVLVQDNAAQASRAAEVMSETRELTGWYLSSATVGERDGVESLQRLLSERILADGARRVRQVLDEMEHEERLLLKARQTKADSQLDSLKGWAVGVGALFLAFMFGSIVYSSRLVRIGERNMVDLAASANTDPLTGLANRRALNKRVKKLNGQPFSVLAFDLDDFKPVNDRHGHAAGDEVLRVVAQRLKQQCRDGDVAVRIGGDEFLVLFPGLDDVERLEHIQERVSQAIGAPIQIGGAEVRVGASIGYAATQGELRFEALVAAADGMSYEKKKLRKAARAA
ncbi:diguanylate cyclase domain-containing protein [Burkholderiaceae bacterium UC74_6]